MATNDMIFGVYQDWVHQNPGTLLYGGIEEDDNWQNIWKKLICFTTQRYDLLYGRIGNWFVKTLKVIIDGICNQQWNAERVIIFHTVILQRFHLIFVVRNIGDCIN